jgi:hypothetical protein
MREKIFMHATTSAKKFCLLSAMVLSVATSSMAEEQNLRVEVQLAKVSSSRSSHAGTVSSSEWDNSTGSGQSEILEEATLVCRSGMQNQVHLGGKIPIVYFDPRVNGAQVQYVDSGLVVDTKVTTDEGVYIIDSSVTCSRPATSTHTNLVQDVVREQSTFLLAPSQTAIVSSVRGQFDVATLNRLYPKAKFGPQDALVITLRVKPAQ